MIWLEGAMLTLLVTVGVECGLHDLKHSTVPNRWLLTASIAGVMLNGLYYVFVASDYVGVWAVNMSLADLLAVAMYTVGLWAAGDVKLFALLYLCLPGRLLDAGTLSGTVIPYIYIFVPALLWLTVDTFWQAIHHAQAYQHSVTSWKTLLARWVTVLLETSTLRHVILLIAPAFYQENELFCAAGMIVYAFMCSTRSAFQRWPVVVLHGVVFLITLLLRPLSFLLGAWWSYVSVLMVLIFQRWAGRYNYRSIPTGTVQRGMILSADTVLRFSRSRVHDLPSDASESMTARLTDMQAYAIKRWETSANGSAEITIVRKMPFAMLISIGFILWILVRIVR